MPLYMPSLSEGGVGVNRLRFKGCMEDLKTVYGHSRQGEELEQAWSIGSISEGISTDLRTGP